MAADLAATPVTGISAQLCGDCHLLNFGGYATPERRLVFDVNDFDETFDIPLPRAGQRLAASFVSTCPSLSVAFVAGSSMLRTGAPAILPQRRTDR